MHIASKTSLIPCGGLAMVLTSEMSCSLRVLRAATAALRAGRAMFNCSSHSSYTNDREQNKKGIQQLNIGQPTLLILRKLNSCYEHHGENIILQVEIYLIKISF